MLIEKISNYVVREQTQELRPQTVHHAKRAVIDWFAAMYPGSIDNPNPLLRSALIDSEDPKHSVVFPSQDCDVRLCDSHPAPTNGTRRVKCMWTKLDVASET